MVTTSSPGPSSPRWSVPGIGTLPAVFCGWSQSLEAVGLLFSSEWVDGSAPHSPRLRMDRPSPSGGHSLPGLAKGRSSPAGGWAVATAQGTGGLQREGRGRGSRRVPGPPTPKRP